MIPNPTHPRTVPGARASSGRLGLRMHEPWHAWTTSTSPIPILESREAREAHDRLFSENPDRGFESR